MFRHLFPLLIEQYWREYFTYFFPREEKLLIHLVTAWSSLGLISLEGSFNVILKPEPRLALSLSLPCGQTQILPKKHILPLLEEIRCRAWHWSLLLRHDNAIEQTSTVNKLKMCMCLKLKFIYNKELACEKQFINSLSCSHYALFQLSSTMLVQLLR